MTLRAEQSVLNCGLACQKILGTPEPPAKHVTLLLQVSLTCPQFSLSYPPIPSNTYVASSSPFTATILVWWWTASLAGGWFNIYKGRGGATCLVDMMTKIFHDFGVPDVITSDSDPVFKSEKFKSCLRQYGVHHRLTSVGFAHANTRAELAVKSAKRLLRDHMSPTGGLDNIAVTIAVLTHRNTPDRDTCLSPGRQLKVSPRIYPVSGKT